MKSEANVLNLVGLTFTWPQAIDGWKNKMAKVSFFWRELRVESLLLRTEKSQMASDQLAFKWGVL